MHKVEISLKLPVVKMWLLRVGILVHMNVATRLSHMSNRQPDPRASWY